MSTTTVTNQHTCNICQKKFNALYYLQRHFKNHTGEKPYECTICKQRFSELYNLKRHNQIHTGERPFECTICSRKFRDSSQLKSHLRFHTGNRSFRCNTCGKKFYMLSHLKRHNQIHAGDKPFECTVCKKKFNDFNHLKRHTQAVHSTCLFCNKGFNSQPELNDHVRCHIQENPFFCSICGKEFRTIQSKNLHEAKHHHKSQCLTTEKAKQLLLPRVKRIQPYTGKKLHECPVCHKEFNEWCNLKTHTLIHTGVKPFACTTCLKRFNTLSNLKVHIRIHTGEKPFECSVCRRKFNCSSNLKRHKRIHKGEKSINRTIKFSSKSHIITRPSPTHGIRVPFDFQRRNLHQIKNQENVPCLSSGKDKKSLKTNLNSMPAHTLNKLYACSICDKKFIHYYILKRHIRTHTGDKPFECTTCQKRFHLLSNLKRHSRIHGGEKRFECSVCQKTFYEISYLKRHAIIHTGEKPYQCNICHKRLNLSTSLTRHFRIHTESDLKKHTLHCHNQNNGFLCKLCGDEFKSMKNRDLHVARHHDCFVQISRIKDYQTSSKIRIESNVIPHSRPNFNESFPKQNNLVVQQKIYNESTIPLQLSIAILGAVMEFKQNTLNILVISTCHVGITCRKLKQTARDITIFHEPEDCFNSSHSEKALVCDDNYDSVLIEASKRKAKIIFVIVVKAAKKDITKKVMLDSNNNIKVMYDSFKWRDLPATFQFRVLQNWENTFGFSLNSNQMEYITGQLLMDLVNNKDRNSLQDSMPHLLRRYVYKMGIKKKTVIKRIM